MILINGKSEKNLSCLDRGLQYGDGLFETIVFRNGKLQNWSLHWQRLTSGCERLTLPIPEQEEILDEIGQVTNNADSAVVKILYTRGVGGRGYAFSEMMPTRIIMQFPLPQHPEENSSEGVNLYLCKTRLAHQPLLAGLKHLNRLENVLARNEWNDTKYAEGLLCCTNGSVIEGTMSNIFMVKNGMLYTPELSQCGVRGVTRTRIIQFAKEKKIKVAEDNLSLDDLQHADEIFVCNSVIEIWPVKNIADNDFPTSPNSNPVTRQLQNLLN